MLGSDRRPPALHRTAGEGGAVSGDPIALLQMARARFAPDFYSCQGSTSTIGKSEMRKTDRPRTASSRRPAASSSASSVAEVAAAAAAGAFSPSVRSPWMMLRPADPRRVSPMWIRCVNLQREPGAETWLILLLLLRIARFRNIPQTI